MLLEGRVINLRDWELSDFDRYRYWLKPGHLWHRLDGPYYPPKTAQEIEGFLLEIKKKIISKDFESPRINQVIATKDESKLIGLVSSYWESRETNWLSFGLGIFDEALWRKGYGREAFLLWIDYLFESYPEIVRLGFSTWSGNVPVIKLALSLGFNQEACYRKARIVDGQYYDGMGFGILREEWKSEIIKS